MSLTQRSDYIRNDEGRSVDELIQELSWALTKIRYARAVLRDVHGDPERGAEVLEAIREVGRD